MEFSYYIVKAVGNGGCIVIGYELLQRERGTRRWFKVGNVHTREEAEAWCDEQETLQTA